MEKDLIVEEIHQIREVFSAQQGDDLHKICDFIRQEQKEEGRKTVSREARKPVIQPVAA